MLKELQTINEVLQTGEEITSNYFTLETLLNFLPSVQIQVPLYQRLYVWEIEEIKLFIEDISEAFAKNKAYYYIGNMMFANNRSNNTLIIDLIDGQQRFTTLWLISIILSRYNTELQQFAFLGKSPRLRFKSRKKVNEFFHQLNFKQIDVLSTDNLWLEAFDVTVEPIENGLNTIYNSVKEVIAKYGWTKNDVVNFGNYIYKSLLMVQTTVPSKNNLNQIFESLNSGGKQLENHQILKSRLLKVLKKSNYSKEEMDELAYKWDAVSNMNMYLERSVYSLTSERWENVMHQKVWLPDFESNKAIEYIQLNEYLTNDIEPISLLKILRNDDISDKAKQKNKQQENVRSIISFSQFLLHTLRVFYLHHNASEAVPVDSQNLLKFFKTDVGLFSNADNVMEFITLLFDLRFLFDKFVIKWASTDEDNQDSLLVNKAYFNRTKTNTKQFSYSARREFVEDNKQLSLIQSVLYIVQEFKTQYWITPLLQFLYERYYVQEIKEDYKSSIQTTLKFVENLDNYFYCESNNVINMSELSFQRLNSIFQNNKNGTYSYVENQLNKLNGTNFFRYWFYKTEYLLWKYRREFKKLLLDNEYEIWESYSINFKKSIEHIYPQSRNDFNSDLDKQDFKDIDDPVLKDYFGNLVLLTVSENSEYSNLEVDDKKTKYKLKINNNYIDALKSSLIFKLVDDDRDDWVKGIWNYQKAKYHLECQILPLFRKHLNESYNN